jgi:hypothetical protein
MRYWAAVNLYALKAEEMFQTVTKKNGTNNYTTAVAK